MPILKKIFTQKTKSRQEKIGSRQPTSRITLDPASAAILSKPFMPLDSRAMSPSDLLDSLGHPMILPPSSFRHSSPDLSVYTTAAASSATNSSTSKFTLQEPIPKKKNRLNPLTIRNLTEPATVNDVDDAIETPTSLQKKDPNPVSEQKQASTFGKPIVTPAKSTQSVLLLETSREDKTLVEEEKNNEREFNLKKKNSITKDENKTNMAPNTRDRSSDMLLSFEAKKQFDILQQKLLEFEYERDAWQKRLQGYMIREEQMRKVIQENQLQINQLRQQQQQQQQYYYQQQSYLPEMRSSKSDNTAASRHNSYLTASTKSSAWSDEDYYYDDIEDDELELQDFERQKVDIDVDADDEDEEEKEEDGVKNLRREDLSNPPYYSNNDRRHYSLPAYYPTPTKKTTYPYYQQAWKNYYYDAYYAGTYRQRSG